MRVSARKAGIAEARKASPSPTPATSGHSLRAPIEPLRLVGVHGDEGVVAAQLGVGGAHRGGEVAVVAGGDQVGDYLGVGLGGEDLALLLQRPAQLGVVLDDPVEDDVDLAGAVVVRVGVLLGDAAVGCPTGVGDPGCRRRQRPGAVVGALVDRGPQVGQVADRVDALDLAVGEHREASRVVAPVFELFQTGEQQLLAGPGAHVSDDAAHEGE